MSDRSPGLLAEFNHEFAQEVVRQAVDLMRAECESAVNLDLWAVFESRILQPLTTGEAPTEDMRARVFNVAKSVEKVRTVHNEIRIAAPSPISARTNDSWLTTSVKTKIVGAKELSSIRIKVVSEAATVYLLGLVSQQEGDLAAQLASQTAGVQRVVKLFEYQ